MSRDRAANVAHFNMPNPDDRFLPLADLGAWAKMAPQPQSWILDRFIPEGEVTLITGQGGTNKSTFGLQICACLAVGQPMLGIPVQRTAAMYVTVEDDEREGHWRLDHMCSTIGTTIAEVREHLHISILRGQIDNELSTFDAAGRMSASPKFERLRATIDQTGAQFLVLDNVGQLFSGNENERSQVTKFVNLLYSLCGEFGMTILLIAHPNKSGDSYSGSTAWPSAVRSHIFLQYSDDGLDPDARVISTEKSNRSRKGERIECRWHDFALVCDADLPDDQRASLAASIAIANENVAFLACLRERKSQGDARAVGPSPGPNYAPKQFEGMPQAKGLSKDQLARAMNRLFSTGAIAAVEVRNKDKGRTVTVIREADSGTPNSTPNSSRTLFPNSPELRPNPPRSSPEHTPPPTEGGSFGGPPPLGEVHQPDPDHPNARDTNPGWNDQP